MRVLSLGLVLVAGAVACGGSSATSGDDAAPLVFTRNDGSAIPVPDLVLVCEQSRSQLDGQVVALRTADMGDDPSESRVMIEVLPGSTGTYRLPFDGSEGKDPLLFVLDKPTGNEASAEQEDASGSVVIREASCEGTPRLDMTVDAVLGSESFEGAKVTVRGDVNLSG